MIIKNRETLQSHGKAVARGTVLDLIEAGIAAADPYDNAKNLLHIDGDRLVVGNPDFSDPPGRPPQVFDLRQIKHVYVVGGGKAVQRQAKAFEDVLGNRITDGHICIKKGETVELERIGVTLAGHPLPDQDSVNGAAKIVEIMRRAKEGDIVFWLQSGGGTALLALPAEGISLDDLLQVYRVLYFGAGASMPEANSVRNLIAVLNTQHPKYVQGATLFQFIATEIALKVRGHAYGLSPSGHGNAYERAIGVLKKYRAWDKVPQSVRDFMLRADPGYGPPTPADLTKRPYYMYRVIGPEDMLAAALARARELRLNATIMVTSLNDVEAKSTGEIFGDIAQEADVFGRPLAPPCVFISGGETVVAIGQETGTGGRNQELVLAASPRIAGSNNVVIASVDSDGTDGPTSIAGGIVDGATMERIKEAGFDLAEELRHHNSSPVLEALGDTVVLGATGTNLRDLRVIYVGAPTSH